MYYNNGILPYVSQLLNEINFWVDLSKEHPIFIKKIAQNQEIDISSSIKETLNKNFKDFNRISREILVIQHQWNFYPSPSITEQHLLLNISTLLQDVLKVDVDFLNSLKTLEDLPAKDNSWKIFINHITLEQKQLLQLCTTYSIKLKSMGY
jgi:hypothetical protein